MPKRGPGANDGCEPVIIVASMAEDQSIAGIADGEETLRGFAKIMRDRTDWKLAEQARKESEGRHHRPDIILLDIGLPMMDGFEVVRQLRRRPPFRHTLIVALTGYGTEEDRRRALEAGFHHHLVKPPQAKDLQTLLDQPRRGDAPT